MLIGEVQVILQIALLADKFLLSMEHLSMLKSLLLHLLSLVLIQCVNPQMDEGEVLIEVSVEMPLIWKIWQHSYSYALVAHSPWYHEPSSRLHVLLLFQHSLLRQLYYHYHLVVRLPPHHSLYRHHLYNTSLWYHY